MRLRTDSWWHAGQKRRIELGARPHPADEPKTWAPEFVARMSDPAFGFTLIAISLAIGIPAARRLWVRWAQYERDRRERWRRAVPLPSECGLINDIV